MLPLHQGYILLVEAVRFELTDPFEPTVFKTVAISRTLPRFLKLAPQTGIEPMTDRLTADCSTAELLRN